MKITILIAIVIIIAILVFLSIMILRIKRRNQIWDEPFRPTLSHKESEHISFNIGSDASGVAIGKDSIVERTEREKEARRRQEQETRRQKEEQQRREVEAKLKAKQKAFRGKYRISIAHPKLLSKRYSSRFLIQIYLPEMRRRVSRKLKKQFEEQKIAEHIHDSELETGQEVKLKLFSLGIVFSEPVSKKLDKSIIATNFIAKPNDGCHPGSHQVIFSISDVKTGFEYQSISFTVKVTDFAFDHVSRPFLSRASSFAIGAGSLAMFILTLLGKIDTTFGLTSGTVAGMLASSIYARFISLYHQQKITETP